jgi:hypothetical protein
MKRFVCLWVLLFILSGCSSPRTPTPTPTPTSTWALYATPVASLDEVPIFVGDMTFNELNNSGFTQQYVVAWSSQDLSITTNGKVSGTFVTTYEGPPVPYPEFKDVLFFQVQARYIYPRYGDIAHQPFSEVIPIVSERSSEHSAKFVLNSTFQLPPLIKDIDGGLPLRNIELTLTWVRVYKSDQGLHVQVFAGDANRYPDKPKIAFNQEPQFITARFGYYSVLPESMLKSSSDFDYYTWIKENVKW